MFTAKMKKVLILVLNTSILLALVVWIIWGNTALELNTYTIASQDLPDAFDGYHIAHISDLHNTEIGTNNIKIIEMLCDAEPDIIVITGDLIDSRNTNVGIALEFAEQAAMIAPCYYVPGNHEARSAQYSILKMGLIELGVAVLENERAVIERAGSKITLIGVSDPSFGADYLLGDAESLMDSKLQKFEIEEDGYTILLSHRPELFDTYVKHNIDLAFSGHAHGGQFRIPFVGGLVAPNQGFFPEYDSGLYTEENTNMIVSRGIGNSIIPLRINNRPEVIVAELITRSK